MMILVTGGAGYIGSHVNKLLNKKGYQTIVYDNLIYGNVESVKWGTFIEGDLNDTSKLNSLFKKHNIDAVMHFAAFAYVGESVRDPQKYYYNNVLNTINLLKAMNEAKVDKFIFSSTCATYGDPKRLPMDEKHPQMPINPYGKSKYMVEKILEDYYQAYNLKYVILRYFNAAGADPEGEIGEKHEPETHLIPLAIETAIGKRSKIKVFGNDYDTHDGTCVRDYIHVNDIADAHILALEYLINGGDCEIFNLSNGNGYTVMEVLDCVKEITKADLNIVYDSKRNGDPATLLGSSKKIELKLGWKPKYPELSTIIETAWKWHKTTI